MSLSITGGLGGAFSGFTAGASTGMPHLAGVGAVVGGIVGLFGGGSGSSGGGIKPKKIKEALKIQNELTLQSLKRDAALAIQANEKAERMYNDLRDATYEQELKNYELAIEQRAEAYNDAYDAYVDSVDAFDETVELNDISATMAMNDARRVYNQHRQSLNEQQQLLGIELTSARRDQALNRELIQNRMSSSIKDAQLNANGINVNLLSALKQGGDAIQQSTRSFESATALASYEMQIKDMQIGADKAMLKSEMASLEGEKWAVMDTAELKEREIYDSLDNSIAETDFAQQELRLAQDERYAESAIQTDQLRRQGLLEQSAQISKGQSGRSAAKSVQGLAFANKQAQALIASALVRADSKYVIDKNKLAQSLGYARTQGKSAIQDTSIGLRRSKSEFAAAGLRMSAKSEEIAQRGVAQKAETERLNEARRQTTYANTRTKDQFADQKALAQIELDKMTNDVLATQVDLLGQMQKNDNQLIDFEAQAKLSAESMAFAGQTLESELKINQERIEFDKMLANRAAASQVLDEPKVPDLLPPPIKAPELVQQPLPEIDWKKIEKAMDKARKAGQVYNPGGLSEFNALLQNINSIGEQAAAVANAFKPAPQVQQSETLFPISYNSTSQVATNLGNMNLGNYWNSPAPMTKLPSNAYSNNLNFDLGIDYNVPNLAFTK